MSFLERNKILSPSPKMPVEDSPNEIYETPEPKKKYCTSGPRERDTNITLTSFDRELTEVSRKSKITVPSFLKQSSPFKKLNQTFHSSDSFKLKLRRNEKKIDYNWSIIENFKGNSDWTKLKNVIPCLFKHNPTATNKILVYFHGNNEDLGQAFQFIKYIQYTIDIHIIVVEYPGYGVYEGSPDEETVLSDADRVVEFILKVLKWRAKDIIVMGRSIGTGPAWFLASKYTLGALSLISPYTSIRGIIQNMTLGKIYQYFVKERFNNSELIKKVTSPTFILHGKEDDLIPSEHAEELAILWRAPTCLVIPTEMTHNKFVYSEDFLKPFQNFLFAHNVLAQPQRNVVVNKHISYTDK